MKPDSNFKVWRSYFGVAFGVTSYWGKFAIFVGTIICILIFPNRSVELNFGSDRYKSSFRTETFSRIIRQEYCIIGQFLVLIRDGCTLGTTGFFSRATGSFVSSAAGRHVFGRSPKTRAAKPREKTFRAGHFLRLDRNRKPRMKSLWHPEWDGCLFINKTSSIRRWLLDNWPVF